MSKRTRGTRRMPHQRPPRRAPAARSGRPPSALEAAEIAAEEIEHGEYALAAHELEPFEAQPARRPERGTATARTGGSLAARAASEYVYVGQDLRRIALVAALLFALMGILFVLLEVVNIVAL